MIAVLVLLPLMAASQGVQPGYGGGSPYGAQQYNPYQQPGYGSQQAPQYNPNAGYSPQQSGYPSQPAAYGQQQPAYEQPTYTPQQQGYAPQQQGYAPQQQSYAPQQQDYSQQQQGYTPQQQGYAPQQQGYAPQPQGYAPQQQGYAPQQQGYTPKQAQPAAKSIDSIDQAAFPDIGSLKGFGNIEDFGSLGVGLGKGRSSRGDPFTTNLFDKPSAAQSLVGRGGKPPPNPQGAPSAPQQGSGASGQSYRAPSQYGAQNPENTGGYPGPSPYPVDPYPSSPYNKGGQPPSQPGQPYGSQGQAQGQYPGGAQNPNPYAASSPVAYSNAAPAQYANAPASAPGQAGPGQRSNSLFGNNLLGAQDAGSLLPPIPSLYPSGLSFKQPSKPGLGGSAPATQADGYNPGGTRPVGGRPTNPYAAGSGGQVPPSPFGNVVNFQRPASSPAQSAYVPGEEVARGTAYRDSAGDQDNQVYKGQNAYDQNDDYSKANQAGYSKSDDYGDQKDVTNSYNDGRSGGSAGSYQNKNLQTDSYRNNAATKQNLGYDQKNQYGGAKPSAADGEVTYEAPVESDSKPDLPPINALPSSAKPTPAPAPAPSDYAAKNEYPAPQNKPGAPVGGPTSFAFPAINRKRPGQTNIFGDDNAGFPSFGNLKSLL